MLKTFNSKLYSGVSTRYDIQVQSLQTQNYTLSILSLILTVF